MITLTCRCTCTLVLGALPKTYVRTFVYPTATHSHVMVKQHSANNGTSCRLHLPSQTLIAKKNEKVVKAGPRVGGEDSNNPSRATSPLQLTLRTRLHVSIYKGTNIPEYWWESVLKFLFVTLVFQIPPFCICRLPLTRCRYWSRVENLHYKYL